MTKVCLIHKQPGSKIEAFKSLPKKASTKCKLTSGQLGQLERAIACCRTRIVMLRICPGLYSVHCTVPVCVQCTLGNAGTVVWLRKSANLVRTVIGAVAAHSTISYRRDIV